MHFCHLAGPLCAVIISLSAKWITASNSCGPQNSPHMIEVLLSSGSSNRADVTTVELSSCRS
ncbi:hypothetical protein M758_8G093800 [Ceratodon purpureus]|nr:hypothetical protein M758_8G093700 [Ceratodon purpureus]KAG0608283.1 hypothetical protein M758_8G093800 [Ceratodon purpureus]